MEMKKRSREEVIMDIRSEDKRTQLQYDYTQQIKLERSRLLLRVL